MSRAYKHIRWQVLVWMVLLVTFAALPAQAQRVALLPMSDFTRGANGINLPFTQVVEESLRRLGVEMVPHDQVLQFMNQNKLRSFSFLDSFLVKKIGKDLHCAVALLGTMTEIGGRNPLLGLTFTALDTVTGNPAWSETGATSVYEKSTFLALEQPETVRDLSGPLLDQLLLRLEGKVEAAAIPDSREYQLTGMQLFPAYVRGRQQVGATLKIRFLDARPNRVIAESEAGRSPLQLDSQTNIFSGQWFAPDKSGHYPINLVLEWGSGFEERIENIASYQVINDPPGLSMEIKKGKQMGDRLAFRDHLLILPRITDLKPMARWGLEIRNRSDQLMVNQEYEGDMPERMVWEGHGGDGFYLADGQYDITLLVWDLAGNRSSDTRRVVMQRNPPQLDARVLSRRGKTFLSLAAVAGPEFPFIKWTANLKSEDGKLLLQVEGGQLPKESEFAPIDEMNAVYFSFNGVDQLGNRRNIYRKELLLKVEKEVLQEREAESWVPDF